MQQFVQLCKKNFIAKARNKRAVFLELYFVLLYLGLVIFLVKINSSQLSAYPALPALPLASPAPLGPYQQSRNLTYLYWKNPPQGPNSPLAQPDWYHLISTSCLHTS
jgi:hypothetical protein